MANTSDVTSSLTFQVTGGTAGAVTISGAVPNGTYTIEVGLRGGNSEYIAVITPVGVAENPNFQRDV
jgi:hypothetical protein